MEQKPGEPARSTTTLKIPPMTVAPGLLLGVYANQIRQVTSGLETTVDFSVVYPKDFDPETLRVSELGHDLVARVIVSPLVFRDFVRGYVRNNPGLLDEEPLVEEVQP